MDENSRYRYCTVLNLGDANHTVYLDEREPFRFRDEPDNKHHTARDGDTWWGIAWKFFRSFRNPALMYWLLCEYQPEPIIDPTIKIAAGTDIVIPSDRVIRNYVFNRENRRFHH